MTLEHEGAPSRVCTETAGDHSICGPSFRIPRERRRLLADGWKSIGRIFIMTTILDVVYQLIVFRRIYPIETLDVTIILAVLPYALLRGPFNRLAGPWARR